MSSLSRLCRVCLGCIEFVQVVSSLSRLCRVCPSCVEFVQLGSDCVECVGLFHLVLIFPGFISSLRFSIAFSVFCCLGY